MKIEIQLDDYRNALANQFQASIASKEINRLLQEIVERHKREVIGELIEMASKISVSVFHEPSIAASKIVITTPDE